MDGEQRRHATTGLIHAPEQMARALRRDHPDVDPARRVDPPEVDVEAVGEHQQLAGPEVRPDVAVVDRLLSGVGHEDHDHVRLADRLGHVGDAESCLLGERPALRARRQPDDDVDARFVKVQRVGVALRPVADDRDLLTGEGRRVSVVVVIHPRGHRFTASSIDPDPRDITTAPVLTSSLIP
jgi:hypothetical protein